MTMTRQELELKQLAYERQRAEYRKVYGPNDVDVWIAVLRYRHQ
jgi:hypothetical protein